MGDEIHFAVRSPSTSRPGWEQLTEYSAGGLVWQDADSVVFLKSKTGAEKSFYIPKGHVDIVDSFAEDIITAGIRETREEMNFPASASLRFNGFVTNYREQKDFEKSKEQSFKTITIVGLSLDDVLQTNRWIHEEKHIVGMKWDDVYRYVHPDFEPHLREYHCHLSMRGKL
ncbi:MAG TPA: NUDIX hydrolase [Acidobacteriota bacterium]|nr:NUDIX hydrolase [Acidobacteriota bacterium]